MHVDRRHDAVEGGAEFGTRQLVLRLLQRELRRLHVQLGAAQVLLAHALLEASQCILRLDIGIPRLLELIGSFRLLQFCLLPEPYPGPVGIVRHLPVAIPHRIADLPFLELLLGDAVLRLRIAEAILGGLQLLVEDAAAEDGSVVQPGRLVRVVGFVDAVLRLAGILLCYRLLKLLQAKPGFFQRELRPLDAALQSVDKLK